MIKTKTILYCYYIIQLTTDLGVIFEWLIFGKTSNYFDAVECAIQSTLIANIQWHC